MYEVYKITRRESGRSYVGVTRLGLATRLKNHIAQGTVIGLAVAADPDAFDIVALSTHSDRLDGYRAERAAIACHDTFWPAGYNRSPLPLTRAGRLGIMIKSRRTDLGLTLAALARVSGMTKTHVWELELGRASNPRVSTLRALGSALGVSAVELFRAAMR